MLSVDFGVEESMIEDINNDRKVYDACRRYKFYWTAYQEIKRLDKRFWNKHIRKAHREYENKLNECLLELLESIINPSDYMGWEVSNHYEDFPSFGGSIGRRLMDSSVSTSNPDTVDLIVKMIQHKMKRMNEE